MPANLPSILPDELRAQLATGCCLVDVREPVEHAAEHIDGAKLIPLGQIERRMAEIPPDHPVVVMCHSGKRGSEALRKLQALGFSDARNLDGGIVAWKAANFPTTRSAKKIFPLMQQVQLTIGIGVLTGVILSQTVDPRWAYMSGFFGAGLIFAGSTGWCGLAIVMSKMPWNRTPGNTSCANGNCTTPH